MILLKGLKLILEALMWSRCHAVILNVLEVSSGEDILGWGLMIGK